jgi:glycosyltransferase involved in cell wall biosynthesis
VSIVVDDGSTDGTATIARRAGAKVLSHRHNRGRDFAIRTGLRFASDHDAPCVVLLDADGQHDPSDILKLVQYLASYDVVIGSRFQEQRVTQTPFIRRIGSLLIRTAFRIVYGRTIHDPTSGFRAYSKKAVKFLASDYPIGFSEPETIMRFLREGIRFVEIPVSMQPRTTGSSYLTFFKSITLIYFLLLKILKDVISRFPRNPNNY